MKKNTLTVKGVKQPNVEVPNITFIHRGLAFRDFNLEFVLGEGTQVVKANLDNGILDIYLETNVPEGVVNPIPISINSGISDFLNTTNLVSPENSTLTQNTSHYPV